MDQATFALSVLCGALIGHVAAHFIPRQRHDARAVALLAAVCGSIIGGWLLTQTGATDAFALVGAVVVASLLGSAVVTARRRPPVWP